MTPTKNESLPELPVAAGFLLLHNQGGVSQIHGYTAKQMRAYAEAALTREAPTEGVGGDRKVIGYDPGEDDREAEDYHVIMTMGRLLAAIALSVKGPEPAGTAWSYHDLPDIVAALQEAAEQVADEMTAWAATKMADRGSSRRDRMMISEWAKRLRNPGTFPVKDFEVEGTTLTKEEMRAIVRKVLATPPAPQRLAQGERPSNCRMALRDAGKAYPRSGCAACGDGGLRGCPYERTAQPPHQDRGEVELALLRVAEMLPPKPFGQYVQPGFVMGDKHCRELHARFESLSATITAALTEAKQQETDGPVDATDDADYLRHVAAKLARLGYRIMGAVVEGIAIQYAAMATKQQGPGEAWTADERPGDNHTWGDFSRAELIELVEALSSDAKVKAVRKWPFVETPGALANRVDMATRHFPLVGALRNVFIENPPTFLVPDAPQVEAKRQTGGDHG